MLAYARRLVELNDEAAVAVRGVDLEGWIRLGLQEDFGEVILPKVLGRFSRAHPKVRIEARVARNAELLERIETNELDLALVWGDTARARTHGPWLLERTHCRATDVLDRFVDGALESGGGRTAAARRVRPACLFYSAATAALDRAGISWRVAFTSPSLSGLWAAAAAGLGLTVRTRYGLPASVLPLDADALGLPVLPSIQLALQRSKLSATPSVDRLASIVLEAVRGAPVPWELAAA